MLGRGQLSETVLLVDDLVKFAVFFCPCGVGTLPTYGFGVLALCIPHVVLVTSSSAVVLVAVATP